MPETREELKTDAKETIEALQRLSQEEQKKIYYMILGIELARDSGKEAS